MTTSTDRARKSLAKKRKLDAAERAYQAEEAARAFESYTDEQRADLLRWKFHHGLFIQENLWVPHIDGGRVVPFDLNPGQKKVDDAVEAMRDRDGINLMIPRNAKDSDRPVWHAWLYDRHEWAAIPSHVLREGMRTVGRVRAAIGRPGVRRPSRS